MFKIGMFNNDNIQKHVEEFISYDGHLPYYIMAVLDFNQTGQRIEHLKKKLVKPPMKRSGIY